MPAHAKALARISQFCLRCLKNDHSFDHGPLGCMARVGRVPQDFVCSCEVRVGPRVLPDLPEVEGEDV